VSEWVGLKSFPAATQASLQSLLGALREHGEQVTVLLLGKPGAGKSSTVNSMLGERAAPVAAFQNVDGGRPLVLGRSAAGFTLHVVDTPGLVDGDSVSAKALQAVAGCVTGKAVHAVLYVDRLDSWRVDALDTGVFQALTDKFGAPLWDHAALVLTHGQLAPPEGVPYTDFVAKRAQLLRAAIHATLPKGAPLPALPLALVENSGRCASNEAGEKVLPNATVWLTQLFAHISALASSQEPYIYDPKAVKTADPNQKDRWLIAPLLLFQAFVLRPLLVAQMKRDGEPGHDAD